MTLREWLEAMGEDSRIDDGAQNHAAGGLLDTLDEESLSEPGGDHNGGWCRLQEDGYLESVPQYSTSEEVRGGA